MTKASSPIKRLYISDFIILTVLISLFFGFMLGSRPLSAPDEGRYAEIPREMVVSHDYTTPRLNGVKYFEKPPLMYWLTSLSIQSCGINEWALRLWPALLGLLTCLSVYAAGAHFFSRLAGVFGALILMSNILFYAHARLLILDMAVTFFMTASLIAFLWASQAVRAKTRIVAMLACVVMAACSVLSKGLIGLALPGAITLIWIFVTKNFTVLKLIFKPGWIVLFLSIAAPWHFKAAQQNPEFLDFYFIHEHFLRYLTPIHNRSQAWWFFIPITAVGLFPWTVFAWSSIKDAWCQLQLTKNYFNAYDDLRLKRNVYTFLLIWIAFIFGFFSISNSKLIPYILPIFPPMALLLGDRVARLWVNRYCPRYIPVVTALTMSVITVAIPFAIMKDGLDQVDALKDYVTLTMAILASSSIAMLLLAFKSRSKSIIILTFVTGLLLLPTLNGAWPIIDRRSVKSLAVQINKLKQPGDTIIAFDRYYQDLPPYVNQKIYVVNWRGELDFGMSIEDTSAWMLTREQFFDRYNAMNKVYIVARKESLHNFHEHNINNLKIIGETDNDLLLTNDDTGTSNLQQMSKNHNRDQPVD